MSLEQTAALFVFSLVAAGTPGPSNILLTATGAAVGVRRGLPCLFGVSTGMGAMMFLMAHGVAGALLAQQAALVAAKAAGAVFLLWLAWRIALASPEAPAAAPRPVGFLGAAALQWVNPKAWLVSAGAAATYLGEAPGSALAQSLAFALTFVLAALPSGFVWLAFGRTAQALLGAPRRRRAFNRAMGLALAASVVMILL